MVPLRLCLKVRQHGLSCDGHFRPQGGDNGVGADGLFERFDLCVELFDGCEGDFVAAVLREEDLLGREIEVFVCDDLVPALVCVVRDAVDRDAFVVGGVKDVVCVGGDDESAPLVRIAK